MKPLDLLGKTFGRLTVIERVGTDGKRIRWRCVCACGSEKVTAASNLARGLTRSCGCLQRDRTSNAKTTHGLSGTRLYHIWVNMLARCGNPRNHKFSDYGGRGIVVCAEWHKFAPFADWALANGYSDDLTIDRIDNDAGYSPENCRWSTSLEQSRNKRAARSQKLTDKQVAAIRRDARPQAVIAAEYSILPNHVSRIKSGKRRVFSTEGCTA